MQGHADVHLLERDRELGELRVVIEGALAGRGRAVIVEGAAGAGKSALVAAGTKFAASAGLRVLTARGSEFERDFAFGAMRQLFEPVLTAASGSERERLLSGAAEPAGWVIGPDGDGEVASARAGAGFAALHALHWLAINLAVEAPLLLAVDDLHWVDASSLRALAYLAGRIADVPITLIVGLRPAEPGVPAALLDELRASPAAMTLALRPLGPASVASIVRARFADADDELCAACHAESAGNPLYLQELLRALALEEAFSATAVREASVASLADRVERRIARVAPEASALTTAMAVLGDGARLAIAAALAGLDENAAAEVAHRLWRIEVLSTEDPFSFVHPLVRRSIYDQLSVTERDGAHAASARLLREAGASGEAIAAHLGAVRPAGSVEVAAALVQAADQALGRAAPDAAIRWLQRALDEGAPEPSRAVILAELGFAEVAARDMAAVGHLRAALELAEEPRLRARAAVALGEILSHAGRWEEDRAVVAAAVTEFADADPEVSLEVMAYWAVTALYDPHLVEEFERDRERLKRLAAAGDGWAGNALCAVLAAAAAIRGDPADEVLSWAERALADGGLFAERGAGAWASAQILCALVTIDEYERALAACDELAGQARACGSLTGLVNAIGIPGWVFARRGDLADAEVQLRTAYEMLGQAGMALMVTSMFYFLQDAILERQSLNDVAALVEAIELEPAFLNTWGGAMLLEPRGRLHLLRGDRDRAIEDLRAYATTCAALRLGPAVSSWRSRLALALPAQARAEACDLVAEELELARATGLARPCGVALRAAGMLEGGEGGIERLAESVSVLEPSEARLEHARSLVELGAAVRRRGRRAEARAPLTTGMDIAHRCGAERLADRAREELHAAGARPRRIVSTGTDALTASERRVALLAVEGRANAEIAQELYVSLKTVDTHLSHAYAKLGISGQGARKRLAASIGSDSKSAT